MIGSKFDAILLGNGMTINLLEQLKPYIFKKNHIYNIKCLEKLKYELSRYYLNNNANIEKILGRDIFTDADYDIGIIKNLFPALYNNWFDIL